ncbi:low affinity immunoglobulin gamma Fc region receptor III-A-like [Brachionichthys hirsutus]|uniref:low affinity immunoglobulin gamma Fc region receptor III-A-like n=1 Tax=Brachionichthys hirsutus TaxID=412623 RepID=UPI003604ACDA
MEMATLCTVVAVLSVCPNKSQFFQYDSATLSCGQQENLSEWSIKRNTSNHKNQEGFCDDHKNTSDCVINVLYPFDTGVYWCESAAGECSDAFRITVTGGPVILESPFRPVTEGDNVTLTCRAKETLSNRTADFYKDGLLIRSGSTGSMTIVSVSKSDEGLYMCNFSGSEKSSPSYLAVTGHPAPQNSCFTRVSHPVVAVCLPLASLLLLASVTSLCLRRSLKGDVDPDVLYTDVTIMQEVPPNRVKDVDAVQTIYSAAKPGDTC